MKFITLFLIGMLQLISLCDAQTPAEQKESAIQSSFIWSSSKFDSKGGYVVFRKNFELAEISGPAELQIFVDSRYLLWINGRYILRGPCRFNPKRPEYDIVDVGSFLRPGKNGIVVLAHNYGNAINGRIMKHVPGFTAVLKIAGKEVIHTDPSWRCSDKTKYLPSPESWNTVPDIIDARMDTGDWTATDYDDSSWSGAEPVSGKLWGTLFPREIPLPKETELTGMRLLPSGEPLISALPIELTPGKEFLVDLGRMALVYSTMVLDADEGSEMTMKYALRYENGKPAEMYGAGNTYTARAGQQEFMTTDQWGCHYMQVRCTSGRIKILGIKLIDRRYPFERIGRFNCSDTMLVKLWDMAVNTIEVTCDDGYGSDARERDEWLQDPAQPNFTTTRVALAGPGPAGQTVYSDPRLLKNLLRHAAQSQLPDGRILATFPTDRGPEDCHYVIEDYSCQWVEALKIYYNSTGDKEFVREMIPAIRAQMSWFLSHLTSRDLLLAREYTSFDNPFAYITCEGATLNAFFYQALVDAGYLLLALGEKEQALAYSRAAEKLKTAYNAHYWNTEEGAYNAAFIGDKIFGPTAHAQLIALDRGLVPENRTAPVRNWFLANYKNPGMNHVCKNPDFGQMVDDKAGINMPVVYYWVFQELYRMNTPQMDLEVIREIRRRWTPMVSYLSYAGTLAESFMNEKGEGSTEACHNYGSVPAYFLSSYILGIRLESPVWEKKLLVEPRLGDLTFAEGIVVTEFGPVPVAWRKSPDGKSLDFNFIIPQGVTAEIHLPKWSANVTLNLNGKELVKDDIPAGRVKIEGRWMIVENVQGDCFGKIMVR